MVLQANSELGEQHFQWSKLLELKELIELSLYLAKRRTK